MRRLLAALLLAVLAFFQAPVTAQARTFTQPELDALLAPVALYPDALLSDILVAATYPDDIREAAEWSRANPQLTGQHAVRAVEPMPWHPSLKALVAFPDLLARMDESPRWVEDLGEAYLNQEPHVMDTVQALRRRAQAAGTLPADPHYSVQQHGQALAVVPVQPHVAYVPYYNPYVVYGSWWWPSYRPVYWRPWHPRPAVYVSTGFFRGHVDWHRRHVVHHHHHHRHHAVAHPRPHVHHHQRHRPHAHQHRVEHPRPIVGPAPTLQHTPQHREHRPLLRQDGGRRHDFGHHVRQHSTQQKSGQQPLLNRRG